MSTELLEALNGQNGAVDAWLETHSEREVRAAIRALMAPEETLRDKFAAKAMQTMLFDEIRKDSWAHTGKLARDAYNVADAMLEARKS